MSVVLNNSLIVATVGAWAEGTCGVCDNGVGVGRVASMQDGALEKGSESVMRERIRNLRRHAATGRLWLIDNESGLVDAYELLYQTSDRRTRGRFYRFHRRTLRSVCVFRRRTLAAVAALARLGGATAAADRLVALVSRQEALYTRLPPDDAQMAVFRQKFATRLRDVVEWARTCAGRAEVKSRRWRRNSGTFY